LKRTSDPEYLELIQDLKDMNEYQDSDDEYEIDLETVLCD